MVSGKRSATGHPLFVAGPQIGYYYPGLTFELDLHGPGLRGARRLLAGAAGLDPDRPRARLRLVADLGRIGHDRRLRRDALRRQRPEVPVQGPVPRHGDDRRRRDRRPGRGRVPPDRPRAGHRLRDGRRHARRDLAAALELHARRAVEPAVQGRDREQDQVARSRSSSRPRCRRSRSTSPTRTTSTSRPTRPGGCRCATRTWTRACRRRARASSSGRASCRRATTPFQADPQTGCSSTGTTSRRRTGAPPTTTGPTARSTARRCWSPTSPSTKQHTLASVTGAMNAAATQDFRSVALTPLLDKVLAGSTPPSAA